MKSFLYQIFAILAVVTTGILPAQIPQMISYQGKVAVGAVNFDGSGQFRFALVNGDGSVTYWSNDGTSTGGSQPAGAVSLTVTKGLYSVLLGDASLPNMTAIPNAIFNNADVRIRVWFNDGSHGSQRLSPDQRIAAVGYAIVAAGLDLPATSGPASGTVTQGGSSLVHTFGTNSLFVGTSAGNFTLAGPGNTGLGSNALSALTTGYLNTATGFEALLSDTTGGTNTATGCQALRSNIGGGGNTASGFQALYSNVTGGGSVAVGYNALFSNDIGYDNTAVGFQTLQANTSGFTNTALGYQALQASTTGSNNIALGFRAGVNLTTTSNNIDIGNPGVAGEAGIIRIGTSGTHTDTYLTGVIHGDGSGLSIGGAAAFNGGISLAATDGSGSAGTISQAGTSFIHSFGLQNFFAGSGSGNFTMTGNGHNTAVGFNTLSANSTGDDCTAIGANSLHHNTTGNDNTALGSSTLYSNTTGLYNTATGAGAMYNNTTGTNNSAHGDTALWANTTGDNNTALGESALYSNTAGNFNTGAGSRALSANTTGVENTASGFRALLSNTTAGQNVAIGAGALQAQSFDNGGVAWTSNNTAVGRHALYANQPTSTGSGVENAALAAGALESNTTGSANTACGFQGLYQNTSGHDNTVLGRQSMLLNSTGSFNIAIGSSAGSLLTTGDSNIDIGHAGVAGESNTIRIGTSGPQTATFIAGIVGATSSGGTPVFINSDGKLGTVTSSRRFKENIQGMAASSECLLSLRPVTFRYKPEIAPARTPQWGLIAEEVYDVNPDLVMRDEHGVIQTVRYDQVNAMLLNEFLKDHHRADARDLEMAELRQRLAAQEAREQALEERLAEFEQLIFPASKALQPTPPDKP